MTKTVLLTGAAGFTGRHFIEQARRAGLHCVALCHKPTDVVADCSAVVVANLTDKEQLKTALKRLLTTIKPDYVVHLAGVSFVPHASTGDIYQTNLTGTVNLLDVLIGLHLKPQKVLIVSSGNIYGNVNNPLPVDEQTQHAPVNDYAVSKYAMELAAAVRFDKLPITIVRPFNYTGVGQGEHFVIPKIVAAYKRKSSQIELGNLDVDRDFSDVRDVVSAYIKLLDSEPQGNIVNICSGKACSLHYVIDYLNSLAGYQMDVRVNPELVRLNEIKVLYGCNLRLKQLIGDSQNHAFEETLQWMYQATNES
jgi:nucleoside-diphosphate-sugar epimerase